MIFDFNEAFPRVGASGRYDICICGTGPAGITTALRLAARGKRILLLEGGDLSYTDRSQDLYEGQSIGRRYWHVQNGRLRFFGGTSNHWTGRCGVFDPIDFEARDYFGLPGWPISREEVLAGLSDAKDILDLGEKELDPHAIPAFESKIFVQSGFALSPPTRFAEKYEAELKSSDLIDLFYNASLTDIRLNERRSSIDSLSVRSFGGNAVKISASKYVLALGAIENARLLLNSNNQEPSGVGNGNGMVGRCFMEHLNVSVGRFLVTNPDFWRTDWEIVPTAAMMRQQNIGNGILHFEPNGSPQSSGRLRVMKQFLRETSCALPSLAKVARAIVDYDCPGDGLISTLIEQTPNLASRVSLGSDLDELGLRRVRLDWEFSDQDLRTIRTLAMKASQEMARVDLARVQLAPFIVDPKLKVEVGGHAHQMGTTRMASDPKFGVVNEDCKVYGIDNLYIAGSSVFPTGGGTNPTLTVILLALRLANHLSAA